MKGDRKNLTIRLPSDLYESIKKISRDIGIPINDLITIYLKRLEHQDFPVDSELFRAQ